MNESSPLERNYDDKCLQTKCVEAQGSPKKRERDLSPPPPPPPYPPKKGLSKFPGGARSRQQCQNSFPCFPHGEVKYPLM